MSLRWFYFIIYLHLKRTLNVPKIKLSSCRGLVESEKIGLTISDCSDLPSEEMKKREFSPFFPRINLTCSPLYYLAVKQENNTTINFISPPASLFPSLSSFLENSNVDICCYKWLLMSLSIIIDSSPGE